MKKKIGKSIRQRRLELNLELSDLSDFSGLSISAISNIENAKANSTLDTLEKLLTPLGLELEVCIRKKSR